jgi:hypothetical protein
MVRIAVKPDVSDQEVTSDRSEPLIRFVRSDVREPRRFSEKRPWTFRAVSTRPNPVQASLY